MTLCLFYDLLFSVDINIGQWSEEPDSEGKKHRTNSLTVAVHASFGPKTTPSTQHEVKIDAVSFIPMFVINNYHRLSELISTIMVDSVYAVGFMSVEV